MPGLGKLHCGHGPANTFVLSTPIGDYQLVCCPRGIHNLDHIGVADLAPDWSVPVGIRDQLYPDNGYTYKPALASVDWLQQYFDGSQTIHTLSLPTICHLGQRKDTKASTFRQCVWKTLAEQVPFGKTVSYGHLAGLCGNSKAAQAVGQAMRANPVSILVPCHRVVLSTGQSGNYAGGKKNPLKQFLLRHESVKLMDT